MPSAKKSGPNKSETSPTPPPTKSTAGGSQTSSAIAAIQPLDQIRIWLVEGHPRHDIIDAAVEKFRMPKAKAAALIDRAFDLITETGDKVDTTTLRGWCIEAYGLAYRKMVEIGDYANALKAVDKLWKIANE